MIRAVTLDFWNTLMDDFMLPEREALRTARLLDLVGPYGHRPGDKAIAAAFRESWDHFDRVWYEEARTPTTAESAAVVLRALKIKLPGEARAAFVTDLEEILLDCPPRPVPGVPETLPVLAERYALAVVCDAGITPGRVLRRVLGLHDLERYFSAFFFSNEHGVSKPDPRAFLTPLAELGVAPHEAVHVGDIQRTDVAGAHGAGLQAIHFVGVNSSDLLASNAEAIVQRFAELPDAVARLS